MNINLIDTLLSEKPIIDRENHTVNSEISLSNILQTSIETQKFEFVFLPSYLDEIYNRNIQSNSGVTLIGNGRYYPGSSYSVNSIGYLGYLNKFENAWKTLKLDKFIISKKLLDFFIYNCDIHLITSLFKMEYNNIKENERFINIFTMIINKFNYLKEGENGYLIYGKKSNQIRYGKFVNMIIEMILDKPNLDNQRMRNIEFSVDIYKSKFSTREYKICILTGKDILVGYNRRYQKGGNTMLYNSCMNSEYPSLKLYTINPKKIFLLVITNNEGKIISRNLIWKLKKYNNYLFDRVYAMDNYIRKTVLKLARYENWIMFEEGSGVQTIKRINKNGESKNVKGKTFSIRLSFRGVKKFPYCDTMKYQRIGTRRLTNKKLKFMFYRYEQTRGDRTNYAWI